MINIKPQILLKQMIFLGFLLSINTIYGIGDPSNGLEVAFRRLKYLKSIEPTAHIDIKISANKTMSDISKFFRRTKGS